MISDLIRSSALLAALAFYPCLSGGAESEGPKEAIPIAASARADLFFDSPSLSIFRIDLGAAEYAGLTRNPRHYVAARVLVDDRPFEAGVRLQGTGNFEPVSRHPNLTIKFNWKARDQEFAGLTKLHLKNARQDPTFLCELAASAAFADAGIPTPRITHGRVVLNGRDLGLCVIAEAVNKRFLRRHFNDENGALYEGAFRDVRSNLEQDNGPRAGGAGLKALGAAALVLDRSERRQALSNVLELEKFLDFMAVEMIVANWDGYALHQNNYRVYHHPGTGRMTFIPHGLDNTFFESGLSLMPPRKSVLAAALLEFEEDRNAFRDRVGALLPKVLDPDRLRTRLRSAVAKMKQGASPEESAAIERKAALLEQHAEERLRHLKAELDGLKPATPSFSQSGAASLEGWVAKPDWNDSPAEMRHESGKPLLSIRATNGFCFGSWRLPLWLPAGRYRLEGLARCDEVRGLPSMTGSGAGVRVLGTMRGGGLDGSQDWTPVQHEFSVQEGCEWVELIAELRAFTGGAMFDLEKLRLVPVRSARPR